MNLSCYVVIEVKIGEFDFQDLGQLSGYVVACNHILRKEGRDNPTIGLLICRQKDSMLAQYALEGSNLPLGISEYELSKLYPEKVEGTMPTIEEIEARLGEDLRDKKNENKRYCCICSESYYTKSGKDLSVCINLIIRKTTRICSYPNDLF